MSATDTKIRELLKQGKSGSAIAKELGIRKQTALQKIRQIQGKQLNKTKITVKGRGSRQKPVKVLDYASKQFIHALYVDAYPRAFIKRLVHIKHPAATYKLITAELKELDKNDFAKEQRRLATIDINNRAKLHKGYKQHRLNGKMYVEADKGYSKDFSKDYFGKNGYENIGWEEYDIL